MIIKSPFPDVVIPNITFSDYLLQSLDRYGDEIALIDAQDDTNKLTFKQVKELSIKCASAFAALDIGRHDLIATCFSNCLEFPVILIAAAACGAGITTCNPLYTNDEIKRQFSNSEPKIVFVNSTDYERMKEIAQDTPSIKHIFTVDQCSHSESVHDLISKAHLGDYPHDAHINTTEDILLLPYSSGTTGLPKGVMLTQRNIIALGEIMKIALPASMRDVIYLVVPMFHIYGILLPVLSLLEGVKLVIEKRFSLESFFISTQKHKITNLAAVPPMVLAIYNSDLKHKYDISSLTNIFCGAAPLPDGVAREVAKDLKIRLYQGWGLTEGVFTTAAIDPQIPINSVGVPTPNTRVKVIDVETGKTLGPYKNGEICGKGPQVMKGYYKNISATRQCIDGEGWLHTGDIGYYDKYGCFYIVDRLKELIKYKGFQVAPAELEELLLRHPKVADAAVIGVLDLQAGELPKAFLVKKEDSLTAEEIHKFVEGKVSSYKYLRGGIVFQNFIPKSASGKILRRELREMEKKSKL